MKKGRFLWSAHRITEKQKVRKARNIKEKQLKNSRNTVSKQLVVHHSSASVNKEIITSEFTKPQKIKKKPANAYVCGFSFYFKENIKQYKNTRKKVYR